MPKIPIGIDDFYKLATQKDSLIVDKTELIKEIIEDFSEVLLFIRPRRWGKTLNMKMLQCFFAPSVDGQPTAGLFDRFEIAKIDNGGYLKEHQGKYPVIFISFKDVQADTFENYYQNILVLIRRIYNQFSRDIGEEGIKKLGKLAEKTFNDILGGDPGQAIIGQALAMLSEFLYYHYKQKVYILIDEYDKPLNAAYGKKDFNKLDEFMRTIFSSCLKSNSYLKKGIMTGVLRISKGTMLSGLNNLNEISLLDTRFAKYFGFIDAEVTKLLAQLGLLEKASAIKNWYNGYTAGGLIIYNPWSIMKCLEQNGQLGPYWLETTDDTLIKRALVGATPSIKDQLLILMQGENLSVKINKNITYGRLAENETGLWSLLLFTGYLKVEKAELDVKDNLYQCNVSIPNHEIMGLYNNFMISWFTNALGGESRYTLFIKKLLTGEVKEFTEDLGAYLLICASIYDVAKQPEAFYHGFVLALIASLQDTHLISSNRESGLGRYDVMIIPKQKSHGELGIILEFKHTKEDQDMETVAKSALKQIDEYVYDSEFQKHSHVHTALKVGMAFSGKSVVSIYTSTDLTTQKTTEFEMSEELSLEDDYIEQIKQLSPKKDKPALIASQEEEDLIIIPAPKYKKRRIVSDSSPEKKDEQQAKKQKTEGYEGHNIFTEMGKSKEMQQKIKESKQPQSADKKDIYPR